MAASKRASTYPDPPEYSDQARIEYVELDEILEWEHNPKAHDTDEITKSIQRFGFVAPGSRRRHDWAPSMRT